MERLTIVHFSLQVGIACSYIMWALSYNFKLFVLARIVGGISKGNVSLSTTIVTDVSTRKTRGKGMVSLCVQDVALIRPRTKHVVLIALQ